MDETTASAIFTRMYQALDMLQLLDGARRRDPSMPVGQLFKEFFEMYPEDPDGYAFANQHFLMGCLSAFIVIPHETIDAIPECLLIGLDQSWSLAKLKVLVGDKDSLILRTFVRRIRNSISHGRFEITDVQVMFCDRPAGQAVDFQVQMPVADLVTFCKRFNLWFILSTREAGAR